MCYVWTVEISSFIKEGVRSPCGMKLLLPCTIGMLEGVRSAAADFFGFPRTTQMIGRAWLPDDLSHTRGICKRDWADCLDDCLVLPMVGSDCDLDLGKWMLMAAENEEEDDGDRPLESAATTDIEDDDAASTFLNLLDVRRRGRGVGCQHYFYCCHFTDLRSASAGFEKIMAAGYLEKKKLPDLPKGVLLDPVDGVGEDGGGAAAIAVAGRMMQWPPIVVRSGMKTLLPSVCLVWIGHRVACRLWVRRQLLGEGGAPYEVLRRCTKFVYTCILL
ncbi:hypothetical protein ACLOJK_035111 [Asimina triloba]